jgi:hypothetical protein
LFEPATQIHSLLRYVLKLKHIRGILHPKETIVPVRRFPTLQVTLLVLQEEQNSRLPRDWLNDVRPVLLHGKKLEPWDTEGIAWLTSPQEDLFNFVLVLR